MSDCSETKSGTDLKDAIFRVLVRSGVFEFFSSWPGGTVIIPPSLTLKP